MTSIQIPTAKTSMWIRCALADAFRSFIEPERLSRFWLAQANAPTEAGLTVQWSFLVPGAMATTRVLDVVANKRIRFEWPGEAIVELGCEALHEGTTVSVELSELGELS